MTYMYTKVSKITLFVTAFLVVFEGIRKRFFEVFRGFWGGFWDFLGVLFG